MTYEIKVEEYDSTSKAWMPYLAQDLQVEFVMLDPYVRTSLVPVSPFEGWYKASFQAPD